MLLRQGRNTDQSWESEIWGQKHHFSQLHHLGTWHGTQRGQSVLDQEHERSQGHTSDQGIPRMLPAAQSLYQGLRDHSQAHTQHNEEGSQLPSSLDRRVRL